MKRLFSFLLALTLVFSQSTGLVPAMAAPQEDPTAVHAGHIHTHDLLAEPDPVTPTVTFTYQEKVLTITGTGDMPSYAKEAAPWAAHGKEAEKIIIADGVTSVSEKAFAGFAAVKELALGKDVAKVDISAFTDCVKLATVTAAKENKVFHVADNLLLDSSNALILVPQSKTSLALNDQIGAIGAGVLAVKALKNIQIYNDYKGTIATDAFAPDAVLTVAGTCQSYAGTMGKAGGYPAGVTISLSHPNSSKHNVQTATCVQGGFTGDTVCDDCGTVITAGSNTEIDPANHASELVHHPEKEATCTAGGNIEYWSCADCKKNFSDEKGINAVEKVETEPVEHVLKHHEAKAATCVEEGNVEYWHCDGCKKNYADAEGKQELETVTTEIDPANHAGALTHHEAVKATCATKGNVEYWHCESCGKNYADAEGTQELESVTTEIDPANHAGALKHHEAVEATCTAPGNIEYWHCDSCDKNFSDAEGTQELTGPVTIDPLEHTLTKVEGKAATCAAEGQKQHWHCDKCGKNFADENGNEPLDDIVIPKNPDNHAGPNELRNQKPATCSEQGYSGDTYCKACGKMVMQGTATPVDPSKHQNLTHHEAVASTCSIKGNVEYWHCDSCNKNFSDAEGTKELATVELPLDPGNHGCELVFHEAVKATCTTPGNIAHYTCDCCHKAFSDAEGKKALTPEEVQIHVDLNNHAEALVHHEAVPATCNQKGTVEYWHCPACGRNFSDEKGQTPLSTIEQDFDPANHASELVHHEAVAATCTKKGSVEYWHCDSCNKNFSDAAGKTLLKTTETPVNADNHANGLTHVPAVPATCVAAGTVEYWHCPDCGKNYADAEGKTVLESIEEPVNADHHASQLEHHPAEPATCVAAGTVEYWHCPDCGKNYADAEAKVLLESTEEPINATHHASALEHHEAVPATCVATGVIEYWHCPDCGKNFSDEKGTVAVDSVEAPIAPSNHVSALEHHEAVKSTCTTQGVVEYWHCPDCNKDFADEKGTKLLDTTVADIDPVNHVSPLEHHAAKAATCSAEGNIEYWHCPDCDRNFTDEKGTAAAETVILKIDPNNHVHEEFRNAKDATCSAQGYSGDIYCTDCGKITQRGFATPIDEDNHVNTERRNVKQATCTAEGYTGDLYCTDCGKKLEDGKVTEKAPHTEYAVGRVEPTCTESGLSGRVICSVCNQVLADGEVLPALGHDKVHNPAKAPTCNATGNVEHWHCNRCDLDFSDEACTKPIDHVSIEIDPENHVGKTEIRNAKEATCTEDGYSGDTYCLDCGKQIKTGSVIPKLGHHMTAHDAVAASCSAPGNVQYWSCDQCGKNFADAEGTKVLENVTIEIDPSHHVNMQKHEAKAATCRNKGNVEYWHCDDCGKHFADAEGTQELEVVITEIDPSNHVRLQKTEAKAATCTKKGNVEYWHCADCGKNFADAEATRELETVVTEIDASHHVSLELHEAVEATCSKKGNVKYWHCTDCGKNFADAEGSKELDTVETPIVPSHHVSELKHHEAVKATCVAKGNVEYWHCDDCNKNFADAAGTLVLDTTITEIDPSNHVGGTEIRNAKNATCTEAGYTGDTYCLSCDTKIKSGEEIPATGHTPKVISRQEPTCTEAGFIGGTVCTVCHEVLDEGQPLPALGHNMTHHKGVKATCEKDGQVEYWHCDRCNLNFADENGNKAIDSIVLPKLGHNFGEWYEAKEPTTSAKGSEKRFCSRCDATETRDIPVYKNNFNDVKSGRFYYKPVLWASNRGIATGTDDNTFSPLEECTRSQIVSFLWRANGCPEPKSTESPFSDVRSGRYYYKAVLWAAENDIVTGYKDGTFGPNEPCLRRAAVTFLWRANGCPKPTTTNNPFIDVKEGTYSYEATLWAVENGITNGISETEFGALEECNRAQIVTFLYRDRNVIK